MFCSPSSSGRAAAGRRDWAALQDNMLFCVAGRLTTIDQVTFRAVCRSWLAAFPEIPVQPPHAPYLLLGPDRDGADENETDVFTFLSLPDSTLRRFRIPKLAGRNCVGSQYGWLATVDDAGSKIALLNPFTGQDIPLPPIAALSCQPFFRAVASHGRPACHVNNALAKVVLSSDPADGTVFAVAAIHGRPIAQQLIFTRAGERQWRSYRNSEGYYFCDIAFDRRGRLLGLAHVRNGHRPLWRLIEIDLGGIGERRILDADALSPSPDGELVAHCDGSRLLYALRSPYLPNPLTERIEIREMELEPAEGLRCKIITRLTSLDGCALFMGTGSSVLLSAADVCRLKLKQNCVYFADKWWNLLKRHFSNGEDSGIYNLDDGSISFFSQRGENITATAKWLPPIWVTPSLRRRRPTT